MSETLNSPEVKNPHFRRLEFSDDEGIRDYIENFQPVKVDPEWRKDFSSGEHYTALKNLVVLLERPGRPRAKRVNLDGMHSSKRTSDFSGLVNFIQIAPPNGGSDPVRQEQVYIGYNGDNKEYGDNAWATKISDGKLFSSDSLFGTGIWHVPRPSGSLEIELGTGQSNPATINGSPASRAVLEETLNDVGTSYRDSYFDSKAHPHLNQLSNFNYRKERRRKCDEAVKDKKGISKVLGKLVFYMSDQSI